MTEVYRLNRWFTLQSREPDCPAQWPDNRDELIEEEFIIKVKADA